MSSTKMFFYNRPLFIIIIIIIILIFVPSAPSKEHILNISLRVIYVEYQLCLNSPYASMPISNAIAFWC